MSFALVYGDNEISLPLNFTHAVEDRLLELLCERDENSRSRTELGLRVVEVVTEAVSSLEGPTEKQIRYATAIAKLLSLELPSDVLRSRDAMRRFLNSYAELYRFESARRRCERSRLPTQ